MLTEYLEGDKLYFLFENQEEALTMTAEYEFSITQGKEKREFTRTVTLKPGETALKEMLEVPEREVSENPYAQLINEHIKREPVWYRYKVQASFDE